MVAYDPEVINSYAESLYSLSRRIEIMMMLLFGLPGVAVLLLSLVLGLGAAANLIFLAGAGLGAGLGKVAAKDAVFLLKLHAQTALCQVQIEENTRTEVRSNP